MYNSSQNKLVNSNFFLLQGYLCTICTKLLQYYKTQAAIHRRNEDFFVVFSRYCKLLVYISVQITTYTFVCIQKRTCIGGENDRKAVCMHSYTATTKLVVHAVPSFYT